MSLTNTMVEQVLSLPQLLRDQYADLEPKTRKVLTTPEIFNIQRIILTGCGDSFAASMGMKYVFENLTGIRTELVTTLDLARFYEKKFLGGSPNNPLVIAISNSGQIARLGEALERVTNHGAFVLGVTGNTSSVLAERSSRILDLDIPKFASAPGTRSYMVSVLALLLIAIRIGEVRGKYTMDVAKSYRKDILAQADVLEKMLPELDATMLNIATEWKDLHHFDFVGAGQEYATAWYGMAKVMEATGDFATHINVEEWLHLNFFMRSVNSIGTVVVGSSQNAAFSRIKEMITYASQLGRPLCVLSDKGFETFGVDALYVKMPQSKYPHSMQLIQFAPLAMLFGYLQAIHGEKGGRGCEGPWVIAQGAACVRSSEIVIV